MLTHEFSLRPDGEEVFEIQVWGTLLVGHRKLQVWQDSGGGVAARLLALKDGKSKIIIEQPFRPEEELEKFIQEHPEIIGNVTVLQRQSGDKRDQPDIIAVDAKGSVVVVEVKDETADYDVVSQVLRYALWAEHNPDSVRVLWKDLREKASSSEPDWNNMKVRAIVVAPDFEPSVTKAIVKIGYETSLLRVNRFITDGEEFVVVNDVEYNDEGRQSPVRVKGNYQDPKWHEEWGRNLASVEQFFVLAKKIQEMVASNKWPLDAKFNQEYFGVKYGSHLAFGVQWETNKKIFVFFNHVPVKALSQFKKLGVECNTPDNGWSWVYPEGKEFDIRKFGPVFKAAFEATRAKYG